MAYQGRIKQNTGRNVIVLMVRADDLVTGLAGLTLTITASKDGAAFGGIAPSVTDLGSGIYSIALTSGDTDTLGYLALHITGTDAQTLDCWWDVDDNIAASVAGAVGSVTGAVGSVTGNVGGNVVGSVASVTAAVTVGAMNANTVTATAVADGAIDAATFAPGAIDAAAIATDAIDADALKADAVTKIVAGVMAFAHEAGRTVKGVIVRLDALMTGKAEGMVGTLATFYRADGLAKAFEATQDPALGTRDTASTVAGD